MNTLRFIRYLLLTALAILLIYIAWYIQTKELKDVVNVSTEPKLELYDFEVIRYTVQGQKNYSLTGPYSKHYENEQGSIISEPFLTHFLEENSELIDWTATSLEATISQNQSLVVMNDNVELNTIDKKTKETTILKTSQLLIHDRGDKVTSDRFVTIDTIKRHMEGVGLIGYPKIGSYTLLKDTISTYETNK